MCSVKILADTYISIREVEGQLLRGFLVDWYNHMGILWILEGDCYNIKNAIQQNIHIS